MRLRGDCSLPRGRRVAEQASAIRDDVYQDPAGRWIIRPYRSGDETAILNLFQRVFGVTRSLEHWRWKFLDNPAGLYVRVAETPSGELIGHYGTLPVLMKWGDRNLILTQIIDVMVEPGVRRGLKRPGLFAMLSECSIASIGSPGRASGGYGFPTPEHLRIGQRVSGYVSLHPVQTLTKDLSGGNGNGGRRAWLLTVEEVTRFGAETDRLWQRCRHALSVAIIRDARYMNWRYVDCADVTYRLVVVRRRLSGSLEGIAVLRLGWGDQPIACLVDWLVPADGAEAAKVLLGHCERVARDAGMTQLQVWFPPYAWPYHLLCDHGYRSTPTIYHFIALSTSPEVSIEWAKERWYYTMGDSDIY